MKTSSNKPAFWITNISNRNVTLSDLACNIKAYTSVNLLDVRRYGLTLQQINQSKKSGSLFAKSGIIKLRQIAPKIEKKSPPPVIDSIIPSRQKSIFTINQVEYEELTVSDDKKSQLKMDEEFAAENAELADVNAEIQAVSK